MMMVAWIVLVEGSGCRFELTPRLTLTFLIILALPVITVPFLYLAHDIVSAGHRLAFTELMKYGGLSCLPIGLAVLVSVLKGRQPGSRLSAEAGYLHSALLASLTLFAVGGFLGFLISGLDIVIPAHYHGSTVGVTIAFMGLCYYLLPRLGFGPLPARVAFWQPLLYGGGQLLHISGLAWTGGYGVQRKAAGLAQGVDRVGEIAGMGLMGLGGLISVIGGLLFLVVCFLSVVATGASHVGADPLHAERDRDLPGRGPYRAPDRASARRGSEAAPGGFLRHFPAARPGHLPPAANPDGRTRTLAFLSVVIAQARVQTGVEGGEMPAEPVCQPFLQRMASCFRIFSEDVHHVPNLVQ